MTMSSRPTLRASFSTLYTSPTKALHKGKTLHNTGREIALVVGPIQYDDDASRSHHHRVRIYIYRTWASLSPPPVFAALQVLEIPKAVHPPAYIPALRSERFTIGSRAQVEFKGIHTRAVEIRLSVLRARGHWVSTKIRNVGSLFRRRAVVFFSSSLRLGIDYWGNH